MWNLQNPGLENTTEYWRKIEMLNVKQHQL